MKKILRLSLSALALSCLALTSTLFLTSCDDDYRRPGYYGAPGFHSGSHYRSKKLKPKEKARLGFGRHAGHPHGGPPGQRKKLRW